MSTKQLYLVIRLPSSSSTTVPLPISSQLSIRLPLNSSTSVPLPKVVDLKPKSSTGVLTTIIGRAKLTFIIYLYSLSIFTHSHYPQKCNNRVSNKQRGKPTKTNYLDSLTIYCITN